MASTEPPESAAVGTVANLLVRGWSFTALDASVQLELHRETTNQNRPARIAWINACLDAIDALQGAS